MEKQSSNALETYGSSAGPESLVAENDKFLSAASKSSEKQEHLDKKSL